MTRASTGRPRPDKTPGIDVRLEQRGRRRITERAGRVALVVLTMVAVGITIDPPAQAAQAAMDYQPLSPARILDTRGGVGAPGPLGSESVIALTAVGRGGVPDQGVAAVVLTVTATEATESTFVTVWPGDQPRPTASNLNPSADEEASNAVIVAPGSDGSIQLYNFAGSVHLVADVTGWFPSGSTYRPLVPERVLDTRAADETSALGPGDDIAVDVTGVGGVPASGVSAVAVSVTATNVTALTFVTVWPGDRPRPTASNLNPQPGRDVANLVIATVAADGTISLYNHAGTVDLVLEIVGWFPATGAFRSVTPGRALDTRSPASPVGPPGADEAIRVDVTGVAGVPATGVAAVVVNVTATETTQATFVTVWPGDRPRPLASTLNPQPGRTTTGLTIASVGSDGRIGLYNASGTTELIVDVLGWFPGDPLPLGWWRPPPGVSWQWQLTGAVDTTVDAEVFDLDGANTSAEVINRLKQQGRRLICYVSVGSAESFRADIDELPPAVIGAPLAGWPNERWLDIRRIDVLGPWIERRLDVCRDKGFDAVEPDNVDAYQNSSGFPLSAADQLKFNRFVFAAAHERGLGVALKNDVSQAAALEPDVDFAINEQCAQYSECEDLSVILDQGKAVLHVEYDLPLEAFCPLTTGLGMSSMRKNLNLDAFRQPCPA